MDGIALNDDERKVLEVLGKLHISKNKNVYEATIRKKLPQKYQGNLPKTIKSFRGGDEETVWGPCNLVGCLTRRFFYITLSHSTYPLRSAYTKSIRFAHPLRSISQPLTIFFVY